MNATYYRIEMARLTRDVTTIFFVAVLPAVLYVIFGAVQAYGDLELARGNVAMTVMIAMAAYGAVTATTSLGGTAAVERMQGWGRQLGLTPMTDAGFVAVKSSVALTLSLVPVAIIYVLGALTSAEGEAAAWALSALVIVVGAVAFAFFGLTVGQIFRSEGAVGAASGLLVVLAFLGNVFFPLSGIMLQIAKFTPMYGYVSLARWPVTDGVPLATTGADPGPAEPLWVPIVNLVVWTIIFATLAVWSVRRGRARQ
ncbi:MAG: ABC transporter permease [Actinomycetaceae bacterium]